MRGFKSYIDDGKVPQQNVEKARKIQTNMGDEFSVLVEKEPLNRVLFFNPGGSGYPKICIIYMYIVYTTYIYTYIYIYMIFWLKDSSEAKGIQLLLVLC